MKSILVTGATGFIGQHLLPYLHLRAVSVRIVTRRNFPNQTSLPIEEIQIGKIDSNTDWREALAGIDTVIHLAGRAHLLKDPAPDPAAEFFTVNTSGTINLVKQAIEMGIKHFILMSSVHAMTTGSDRQLTEISPCHPDSPYGQSKRQAEQALIDRAKDSGMTWTILRPTLVYGPGNRANMERLMKLIATGLPLPLASVENRRSFLYVGNLVDAIVTCMDNPKAVNQLFLVSDGQDVSTPELVHLIARQIGKPCKLLPVPSHLLKLLGQSGDTLQNLTGRTIPFNSYTIDRLLSSLYVDSSYIQKTLDWKPPFTLEQGLARTLR